LEFSSHYSCSLSKVAADELMMIFYPKKCKLDKRKQA
jgi:hypothetical protein